MASNKTYIVTKNGEELEQLKTLAAAKKLADAEGAEVYCNGECVYRADTVHDGTTMDNDGTTAEHTAENSENTESPETAENTKDETEQTTEIVTAEPIVAETPKQPFVATPKTEQYRLKKLMNVRAKPSMDAKIKTTKPSGTVVRVLALENDWLHLADGTFILYQNGEFAEKLPEKN